MEFCVLSYTVVSFFQFDDLVYVYREWQLLTDRLFAIHKIVWFMLWTGMCMRPSVLRPRRSKFCSRRDWDSKTLAKTLKLPRLSSLGSFSVLPRCFPRHIVKHVSNEKKLYGLINSHHGKRFLFVILWDFALYFDNYHWIINGLHHKELQLQCCWHEPLCLSQFASN